MSDIGQRHDKTSIACSLYVQGPHTFKYCTQERHIASQFACLQFPHRIASHIAYGFSGFSNVRLAGPFAFRFDSPARACSCMRDVQDGFINSVASPTPSIKRCCAQYYVYQYRCVCIDLTPLRLTRLAAHYTLRLDTNHHIVSMTGPRALNELSVNVCATASTL